MNKQLMHAQDHFLERINQICAKFGLNNIMAQLYALLYMRGKPLSLNDMVEQLKISKGSASVNIRMLERYGVVRKAWVKGSRRDYYEAEKDITKVIMDRVISMAGHRLSELEDMLDSTYRALESISVDNKEERESVRLFKERINEVRKLHDKAHSMLALLNSSIFRNLIKQKPKKNNLKEPALI